MFCNYFFCSLNSFPKISKLSKIKFCKVSQFSFLQGCADNFLFHKFSKVLAMGTLLMKAMFSHNILNTMMYTIFHGILMIQYLLCNIVEYWPTVIKLSVEIYTLCRYWCLYIKGVACDLSICYHQDQTSILINIQMNKHSLFFCKNEHLLLHRKLEYYGKAVK